MLKYKAMETRKITKLIVLALLLVVSCNLKAQMEFAPVGAEWYYEREIYNYNEWEYDKLTYDRFRSVDTITINGILCKEIELFQNMDCEGSVNPYYETRYINQDGNKIYEVIDGERYLLYDFSKKIGEYWTITHYGEFGDTTDVYVQDITEITLEDGSTRRVFVTSATGWDDAPLYCTNIIEGIGLDESLFPFCKLVGPPPCRNTGIRCYSENGDYLISSETDCDYEDEPKLYQSFFGKDSTTINSYMEVTDGDWNYTFTVCNKDTITINDHLYYFVEPKHIESEYGYTVVNYADETIYFREDCENGRLYMHVKNDYVEKDLLLCDMSLNVGDVFLLPTTYDLNQSEQEYYEVVVQSVRDEDGKKIIEFGEVWFEELSIDNLIFTEGTFPMMLLDLDYGFSEMICQHKDGELTYIVSPNIEDCVLPTYLSINEIDSKENIAVHPTIFSNNETISVSSDSEVKDVEMMDILGRNMNITSSQTDGFSYQIRLNERCNSGMYLIIVETENGIRYEKVVLR